MASDGQIKIDIEVDGKQVKVASDELDKLEGAGERGGKGAKQAEEGLKGVGQESDRAGGNVRKFAAALGLVAVASAAFSVLKASMDTAIARFDTLNNFPKVLQSLGVSAEDSTRAMDNLSDGIDGLPTKLDEIASTAQRMYSSFNDMDVATDSALALNNALLGSGASADQASRGTEQYLKALQTGRFYMDTWNTLSETMDVGLIKIAESFGFAGKSAKDDLYKALQSGSITMDEFNEKLIEVGTGTGIMAELAKENSMGMETALSNLRNTAARGIADILTSFDKLSKEVTGKDIAQNIESLKHVINAAFKVIGSAIESTTPIIKLFASGVKAAIPVVDALSPAIIGLVAAYGSYVVITRAGAAIEAVNATIRTAQAATKTLTLLTTAQITAQLASTGATTADIAAKTTQAATISLSSLAIGVMTGSIKLSTAAQIVGTAASYAFGAAIRFMMGPIGWIITGIGLLVTGVIALVKWFNRSTAEADRLNAETEELGNSVNSLSDSVENSSSAYEENLTSIEATTHANEELANKIEELAEKENKSSAEKQMLASYVDQLNESVEGLNLSYNEQADALSMSSEEMQSRIDLMEEQASYNEALERQVEISKEQHEIDSKLGEINELREEWLEKMENGEVKSKEYAAALAELDEQEGTLKETNADLAEQYSLTEQQMVESMEAITEATQSGISNQIIAFEDLSESQQQTVEDMKSKWKDYKDAATDMFDTLSDEVTVTVAEMEENMLENQRVMSEWADNIAILAERGIDEGLLEEMRQAGPESAGHVRAMVEASDEELAGLSEVFAGAGGSSMDALGKAFGIEESGIMEAVGHLVTETESSLKEQIEAADFEGLGKNIPEGAAKGIEAGSPEAEKASQEMAKKTADSFKNEAGIQSPSTVFKQFGIDLTDGLTLGINDGTNKVLTAVEKLFSSIKDDSKRSFDDITKNYDQAIEKIEKSLEKLPKITQQAMTRQLEALRSGANMQVTMMKTLAVDLLKPFDNTPAHFEAIGRDAMAGMQSGLNAGKAQVLLTARSIANQAAQAMRSALDIHSPSRVTKQIGDDAAEGLNLGLKGKQKDINKTSKKMAESVASIIESMHKGVKDDTAKHNKEIIQIEKRAKEDIDLIYAKAAEDKRKLTQAELIRIERITEDSRKKVITIEERAAKDRVKIAQDNSKALIEIAEKYIEDKRKVGEMSLYEEGHFWNQMYKSVEYGSSEYEKALQNHQNVVKQMRSDMESTNEKYAKRIAEIDKKLIEDTKKANEEYTQAYSKRLDDLLNVAGLFDEFVESEGVSGYQLISNLQSQVDALEEYSSVINSLELKIDNAELFAELEELGPKALAELRALNSMSSDELQKYTNLYEARFRSAREQTIKELEPLKNNITEQIKNLNDASQEELEVVEKEWTEAIEKIVRGTEKEFDSMRQVGIDAVKGLEDGMISMESSLMATARRIANAVRSTIQSALDINSPSRVMRDEVGKMIPAGIALGIKENAESVYNELENMASKMIIPASPETALGASRMAYNGGLLNGARNVSTSTDNRKTFAPKIENHFTKEESSPAESTRKQDQMLKKLALEF